MKMLLATSVALASLAFLGACGSRPGHIEPGGPESIVTPGEVDIQDIKKAAAVMLDSLFETGVLGRAKNQPAQLVIGEIKNDTSSRFDLGELTYRMREQLVNSGKALTATPDEVKRRMFFDPTYLPDYTLTGKITYIKRQAGRIRQTTYTFSLTLTDPSTGMEVWTKTDDLTKQGTKSGIGF